MSVNTFDAYCELEARESAHHRSSYPRSGYEEDDRAGFSWVDRDEYLEYAQAEELMHSSTVLEEIY